MRKEFKGTKGEWIFDDIDMKIKGTGDIEGRTVIANVSPKMNYSRGMTTQCANAQLIAAAPELLEALLSLMDGVANLPPLVAIDGVLKTEWEQGLRAINKALGL